MPVGISKITSPTVKKALTVNAWVLSSPASSRNSVLMPQMNEADECREEGQGQVGALDRARGIGHAARSLARARTRLGGSDGGDLARLQ